jgi:iron complex outermembrane receptor protein
MDWRWDLSDHRALSGIVNCVRGKREDIDGELYRIAPPNTRIRLEYAQSSWSLGLEGVFYSGQNKVSATNREQETAGYGLLNLTASWQPMNGLQLSAGVDNLLDREYQDHLAGYNRAANPDIALRERLYGTGVNAYARATYRF